MGILRKINYNESETVQSFGLRVDTKFTEVNARILRPPDLSYSNGNVTPRDGVWKMDNKTFISTKRVTNWGFLKIDYRTNLNALLSLGNLVSFQAFTFVNSI